MNDATIEKELLVMVFTLDKFKAYLISLKVIMYINNLAIKYLVEKKDAKLRLIRCVLLLQ